MDKEREGDHSQISAPAHRGDEASEGASGQEMAKTRSNDAVHPAKSPESSHPDMATTLRKPSASYPANTAFGQLLERYSTQLTTPVDAPTKQSPDELPIPATDGESAQQTAPQKEQKSPFLSILMERGVAVTVARELWQEQAKQAEKYERHLQQSRESYYRTKHPDPEVQREIWRANKARQRVRKKQETQPQEGQKSLGNRS